MSDMLYTRRSFTNTYPIEKSDVCFLGVPFDSTAYAEGNQRFGPVTVRHALKVAESYVPEKDVDPFEKLKVADVGDLDWVPGSFEETASRLKDTIDSIERKNGNALKLFLCGDHSMTYPIVEELEPKTVVQMDAHADLYENQEGNKKAHNTWAKRVEENMETEIVQIGVRSYAEGQKEDVENIGASLENLKEPVYLTLDMDVFDPSYAPHTGYPEENGLSPGDVFEKIDTVFQNDVIGMDVCEISSKTLNNRTSVLAAKSILRALSNL
ncbi:MAG: arginase family protein [Candidatus Aenigmatarchaeota archaeon]